MLSTEAHDQWEKLRLQPGIKTDLGGPPGNRLRIAIPGFLLGATPMSGPSSTSRSMPSGSLAKNSKASSRRRKDFQEQPDLLTDEWNHALPATSVMAVVAQPGSGSVAGTSAERHIQKTLMEALSEKPDAMSVRPQPLISVEPAASAAAASVAAGKPKPAKLQDLTSLRNTAHAGATRENNNISQKMRAALAECVAAMKTADLLEDKDFVAEASLRADIGYAWLGEQARPFESGVTSADPEAWLCMSSVSVEMSELPSFRLAREVA